MKLLAQCRKCRLLNETGDDDDDDDDDNYYDVVGEICLYPTTSDDKVKSSQDNTIMATHFIYKGKNKRQIIAIFFWKKM